MRKIDPECFIYRHTDSRENFGSVSGREFGIYFENNTSYIVYKSGEMDLMYENDPNKKLMETAADIIKIKFKDIQWNILDFT